MNDAAARIAQATLYEGYLLWPYRRSAAKNQQRWTFGGVFPRAWTADHDDDAALLRAQFLVQGDAGAVLDARVRFLHVVERQAYRLGEPVDAVESGGERHLTWEEAAERELALRPRSLAELASRPVHVGHEVAGGQETERLDCEAALVRSWERLELVLDLKAEPLAGRLHRVTLELANETPWDGGERAAALRRATVSTHAVLHIADGAMVSLTDPPEALRAHAAACDNVGVWPVLIGEPGDVDVLLASPIILSDHPQIAPESPGDLFDGGEIDELLILNVLRLTEAEQAEMRASDPRAREILERCQGLSGEELMRLHGRLSDLRPVRELR